MHADRGSRETTVDAGRPPSELEMLHARCWRQANEISALGDTISVLRQGATSLAVQNAELRAVIASLDAPAARLRRAQDGCGTRRRRSTPATRCW